MKVKKMEEQIETKREKKKNLGKKQKENKKWKALKTIFHFGTIAS